jgi:hypothetical protein
MSIKQSKFIMLCVMMVVWAVYEGKAQQAIINMPSADITPVGRNFAMHEMQFNAWSGEKNYWYGTNFYCKGVGFNTEIALTTYNSGFPGTNTNENVGAGFKTTLPLLDSLLGLHQVQITFGTMLTYNLRGLGLGNFSYAHLNMRLPHIDTRLTAGISRGSHQLFLPNQEAKYGMIRQTATTHFIAGFEQPLFNGYLQVIGEWFAGRHDFGFVTTGLLYHPGSKDHVLVLAYKIPNFKENGSPGIVFEYGLFF